MGGSTIKESMGRPIVSQNPAKNCRSNTASFIYAPRRLPFPGSHRPGQLGNDIVVRDNMQGDRHDFNRRASERNEPARTFEQNL